MAPQISHFLSSVFLQSLSDQDIDTQSPGPVLLIPFSISLWAVSVFTGRRRVLMAVSPPPELFPRSSPSARGLGFPPPFAPAYGRTLTRLGFQPSVRGKHFGDTACLTPCNPAFHDYPCPFPKVIFSVLPPYLLLACRLSIRCLLPHG